MVRVQMNCDSRHGSMDVSVRGGKSLSADKDTFATNSFRLNLLHHLAE